MAPEDRSRSIEVEVEVGGVKEPELTKEVAGSDVSSTIHRFWKERDHTLVLNDTADSNESLLIGIDGDVAFLAKNTVQGMWQLPSSELHGQQEFHIGGQPTTMERRLLHGQAAVIRMVAAWLTFADAGWEAC